MVYIWKLFYYSIYNELFSNAPINLTQWYYIINIFIIQQAISIHPVLGILIWKNIRHWCRTRQIAKKDFCNRPGISCCHGTGKGKCAQLKGCYSYTQIYCLYLTCTRHSKFTYYEMCREQRSMWPFKNNFWFFGSGALNSPPRKYTTVCT